MDLAPRQPTISPLTFAAHALTRVGPGWFTSVMGTGILALCVTLSPVPLPGGTALARGLWCVALALFALFSALWIARTFRFPRTFLDVLADSTKAQLLGAPPMACFTIAVGFLRIGDAFLPHAACIAAAQTLYLIGVAGSIASAFVVPYLAFTRYELSAEKTYGSWLLPIVPPIVASVPAALLSPYWPALVRGDMLALAYALLGIGLSLAAIVIVLFYSRLTVHKVPSGTLAITMWLVVGPLGQSIAGIIALGDAARDVWPEYGRGLALVALAYGVLIWGFAMYWLAMAIATTIRAKSRNLPFDLSWWAFTFPVGVLTTGTDALYARTHAHLFECSAAALLLLLASMWSLVAVKTIVSIFSKAATSSSASVSASA